MTLNSVFSWSHHRSSSSQQTMKGAGAMKVAGTEGVDDGEELRAIDNVLKLGKGKEWNYQREVKGTTAMLVNQLPQDSAQKGGAPVGWTAASKHSGMKPTQPAPRQIVLQAGSVHRSLHSAHRKCNILTSRTLYITHTPQCICFKSFYDQ